MSIVSKHTFWILFVGLISTCSILVGETDLSTTVLDAKEVVSLEDVTLHIDLLQQRLDRLESENASLLGQLLQENDSIKKEIAKENLSSPEAAVTKKSDWKTNWKHGIEWASEDGQFKVHIGGRTQFDGVWLHASDNALAGARGADDQDSVNFRRARLRADGTIYGTIDYAAEFDFVNSFNVDPLDAANAEKNSINVPAPTDLWFNFKELPRFGNLRVGNHKEPFGFEHTTSSRFLNFMERSYLQDLFAGPNNNGFTPGFTLFNNYAGERGLWAIGAYKNTNTDNVFARNVGNGEYAATARLTNLLIDDHSNDMLLHVGVAGSLRDPDNERIRFRARSLRNGPSNFATIYADTGTFNTDHQKLAGLELAGVWRSLSLQSEWMGSWNSDTSPIVNPVGTTNGVPTGTIFVQSSYVELHYFLTGEVREYERKAGAFGRVIPLRNFQWNKCCFEPGAWQVACRFENANLNDGALTGGYLNAYTIGLNWFLNPNMKIQSNYVCTERNVAPVGVDGGLIHGFGARLAHDF